jgi:hypothetical protein
MRERGRNSMRDANITENHSGAPIRQKSHWDPLGAEALSL